MGSKCHNSPVKVRLRKVSPGTRYFMMIFRSNRFSFHKMPSSFCSLIIWVSIIYFVFSACTGWALGWHMYHIGGLISHWLSTCGCHWSRPGPGRGSPGGLDSCTHGASTGGPCSATLPVVAVTGGQRAQVDAPVVHTAPGPGVRRHLPVHSL